MQVQLLTVQYYRSDPNATVYHKRTLFMYNYN